MTLGTIWVPINSTLNQGDDVTVDYDGQIRCHSFEVRLDEAHIKVLSSKYNQKWYQVAMLGI